MARALLWLSRSAGGPVALLLLTAWRDRIGDDGAVLFFSVTMPFALATTASVFSTQAAAGERVRLGALARRALLVTAPALLLLGMVFALPLWFIGCLWCGATVGTAVTLEQSRRYALEPTVRLELHGALIAPVGWLLAAALLLVGAPLLELRLAPDGVAGGWLVLAVIAGIALSATLFLIEERSAILESLASHVDRLVLPSVVPVALAVPMAWASRASGVWGALSAKRSRDTLLHVRQHPESANRVGARRAIALALAGCAVALIAWPWRNALVVSYAICTALLLSAHNAALMALDAPYFAGRRPLEWVMRRKQRYHAVSALVFAGVALVVVMQRSGQERSPAWMLLPPLIGAVALIAGLAVTGRSDGDASVDIPNGTSGASA